MSAWREVIDRMSEPWFRWPVLWMLGFSIGSLRHVGFPWSFLAMQYALVLVYGWLCRMDERHKTPSVHESSTDNS